ncbi:hypothetical protein COU37_02030 [Candidatus Micrarchaeota archaeon CG10_big_fil_rev_8_21_14_0_10_45_29]|nr:MAG: hypothetical protein COU37_02030 [Candidatus Micrarchaeota archaeon CG10_big_fil_rev_8_21_14_0_10_45_29]
MQDLMRGFFGGIAACAIIFLFIASFFPQEFSFSGQGVSFFENEGCAQVEPVFSPGSSGEIIGMIRSAQESIDVQMYVFTNEEIARELVTAAGRGVRVRVILEGRVNSYNLDEISGALVEGGVLVRWASAGFKLTHSKMMLLDGKRALVGSINFSKSAVDSNREAGAVIEGEAVREYAQMFENDWQLATLLRET